MKNITTFLLGGLVFISFAAATTNIMTVKPATPRYVIVESVSYGEDVEFIRKHIKTGYILKASTYRGGMTLITMEKY